MNINEDERAICERLVEFGETQAPERFTDPQETDHQEAEALLHDLKHHPHAFVIGCIMDRRVPAERAWLIPYRLKQRIGSFHFERLRKLSPEKILEHMTQPERLHTFYNVMSENLYAAIQLIASKYQGDAAAIWADCPRSAGLVYRFLEFKGVGPKIATMAANVLVRHFRVPVKDCSSIDISPDVHVRRVFWRLELVKDKSNEQVMYRARELKPQFPGRLDLPAWQIGRKWCRPNTPLCSECFMKEVCPTARRRGSQRPARQPDTIR